MKLRIYRTSKWVLACSASEVRLGGRNPYKLEHTDVLQVCHGADVWEDVPVVAEPAPEDPHAREDRMRQREIGRTVTKALDKRGPG